ncbi:tyrosine-type recombinase/integrase [Paenibacillus chibensis]|uniref:Tyrosine-type recombinase/integrase n=1 Tax=Paenibacillus chibensis TaxID=59846 RepID=A0ABU6PWM7_9BACL|nr:tyrosine-type recombinase/integrase [Paenibacillus chibensis]
MPRKKDLPPGVRERDGRYTYRYSVPVIVNGKKTRKQKETISYPTAKEAYSAGILIEADRLNGKLVDEKTISLGGWIEVWKDEYDIEREPRPGTMRTRMIALRSLMRHFGEHEKLKDITSYEYQKYLNQLKKQGRKQGTIRQYHSTAKLLFSDAVRKEIINSNPAEDAVLPAFKITLKEIESGLTEVPKFLEKEQLKNLLQLIRFRGKPQEYAIFFTLAYTGLRIGELMALKVSDINFEERSISITKSVTAHKSVKVFHLGPPKNMSSIRKVSIGDSVIKVLKGQLAWREAKIKNGELQYDGDFLFWSTRYPGYPACVSTIDDRFKILLEQADLSTELTPHSLRHTHVSLLAEAGEQLAVIQERLGHKNDEMTKRVYLHVTEGQRKLIPDRFEQVMNS